MRILTWNLAWAGVTSKRGKEMVRRVLDAAPDVAIFTEVTTPLVDALGGDVAYSSSDYGYQSKANRRKVALWSSAPMSHVDCVGSPSLPPGRFVAADICGIRVIGACIPWRDAHVRSGRKNRRPWEDHLAYVEGLGPIVDEHKSNMVIGGDFNQRNPRHGQPERLFVALQAALAHMSWVTSGPIGPSGKLSIDHILTTGDLEAGALHYISNCSGGTRLSDHFGVYCEVTRSPTGRPGQQGR